MPTYFLTGANRGLGLEFVRQLASSPSNTIIAGIRDPSTDHASLSSFNTHKNVHIIQVDASSASSLSSVASSVSEILGDKPLDFLFNVAGINATSADTSLDLTSESLMQHMQTNVYAPARIVQELKGKLSKGAVVMNVTSGLGSLKVAGEFTKCCTYSMSKAALNMLTVHQSKDLKSAGVKLICVDPGWVKTRMGGPEAQIEADVSIGGMLKVVNGLEESDSGKFYRYDGEIVPW